MTREDEIAEFVETVRRAWLHDPHLRFGQLVVNVLSLLHEEAARVAAQNQQAVMTPPDLFFAEDAMVEAVFARLGNVLPAAVRVQVAGKLLDRVKAAERELGRKLTPFELDSLEHDVSRKVAKLWREGPAATVDSPDGEDPQRDA